MSAAMEQGSRGLKGADGKLKHAEQLHGMKMSRPDAARMEISDLGLVAEARRTECPVFRPAV